MSAWHDSDLFVIEAFLQSSGFGQSSYRAYRAILRSFQLVARRHPVVDRQMLEAWLREVGMRWQPQSLLNQVCIVDRFLDYLVETGMIRTNPIGDLRKQINVKQKKPIWRALASPNGNRSKTPGEVVG